MAIQHKNIAAGEVHIPYNWVYADATARLAASGFTAADVGKLARQSDNNTFWLLTDDSPVTWEYMFGGPVLLKADGSVALSGDLDAGGNQLTNLGNPSADQDAATKIWTLAQIAVASGDGLTTENIQDIIGAAVVDSSTIDASYDDGAGTVSLAVKDASLSLAKLANISTGRLLGRSTASSGPVEEITIGSGLSLSGGVLSTTGGGGGGGGILPTLTKPVIADYTQRNWGTSTVSDFGPGVVIVPEVSGSTNVRWLSRSLPVTPWTITAALAVVSTQANYGNVGIILADTSNVAMITFHFGLANGGFSIGVNRLNSASSYNSTPFNQSHTPFIGPVFLRITDNGTTRTYLYSVDGYNYYTVGSESNTAFLTAVNCGFGANFENANTGGKASFYHFVVS